MHARYSRTTVARGALRVVGWILASLLLLLGIVILLLRTPWGNNTVRDVAESWLRKKLQTEVSIGQFRIHGLQGISIYDLMLKDRKQDTLLSLDTLNLSFRLGQVMARKIDIPEIRIAGLHGELRRGSNDNTFNFAFIVDAFSSSSSETDTSTSAPWDIRIGRLRMDRTYFLWDDQPTGDYYRSAVQTLDLPMRKTDFTGMQFHAGVTQVTGLDTEIRTGASSTAPEPGPEEKEASSPFSLIVDNIRFVDTRFAMNSTADGLEVNSIARTLSLDKISFDLIAAHASGGTLVLQDHETTVNYRSKQEPASATESTDKASPFSLSLDSVFVEHTGLAINDRASPSVARNQFDPGHIALRDLLLKAAAIRYDSSGYRARIWDLAFDDLRGIDLQHAEGDLFFSDTALFAKQLILKTPANRIEGTLNLSYASLETLVSAPATTKLSLNIAPSVLRLDELSYYVPAIAQIPSLRPVGRQNISIRLQASGTLDQLVLSDYRIETAGNLLQGQARIMHPTEPKRMEAQTSIAELSGSRKSLQSISPPGLLPDSVWAYIPERFSISGRLNGSMRSIRPDLALKSTDGSLAVKGFLNDPAEKEKATYDLTMATKGYNLGRALGDTAWGILAGTAGVKGRGLNPETLDARFDVALQEAGFKGYSYNGIDLHGQMTRGDINATISSAEPNIDLDAELAMHYGQPISNVMMKSDIRHLDLHALGFSDSILSIKGHADIRFPVLDSSRLDGTALLDGITLAMGSKIFHLDTISIDAHTALDSQYIVIRSPLADIDIKGRFSMKAIPDAARTILDNWLVTSGELKTFPQPLYAEVQANVHIPDSLAPLIPGLKSASPFIVRGGIDTRENALLLISVIPRIEYTDYVVDSVTLLLMQVDSIARYKQSRFIVQAKQTRAKSFMLHRSIVGGQINKGIVQAALAFFNANDDMKYRIPVTFVNDPVVPYISVPDSIMLNGKPWEVNPDNRVYLSPDKLRGSNLRISQGIESISLMADPTNPSGLPLSLDISNLRLESLTGMFIGETTLLTGVANGKARLSSMNPTAVEAQLGVDSLTLVGSRFGDLRTTVTATQDSRYNIDLSLKGAGNDFSAGGSFDQKSGTMDFQVHMAPLSLNPLAPFLAMYADSVRGGLRGDIKIGGTTKKPSFDGRLSLDDSYLVVRQTGTPLYIPEASVLFSGQQIRFDGMRLLDSAGRPANITGSGRAENLTDISYDLKVQSDKFLVSGRKRYEEQLVSGPLYAGLLLNIRGDLGHADVTGKVSVMDSSQVSYVYRPDDNAANGEGLIEFFDPSQIAPVDSVAGQTPVPPKPSFQLAVNSYISITPTSTVTIVLDELTGDQLTAKGTASLNFTMDPGGGMELTGNYEVESGSYNLTIGGLLRKTFELQKGSTITWSGDILKANTNLTALYKVRTDAEELLREVEALPGASRQKFDFEVYMMIKGEMLKPSISFRLDMPSNEQSAFNGVVYTRLKQVNSIPSELNKQVMGLLALNSFIADNPFNSLTSGGGSFETQAFSTAGRLLTQELNDFLGSVIKDVDIDIGLDIRDDYTSGEAQRRSDLKVGFTKSFASNRLNIYVGNSFALEKHNQNTNAMAGLAGDVAIEYMLTSDGKYRLKGYRQTTEDLTFNGIVVETGVTFVVVLEFNRFKNAFRSKKKRNTVLP